jgi:hypothetical protein
MRSWATCFLFAAIGAAVSVETVHADSIVAGAPGDSATCIPFGCMDVDRYQQVYSGTLFPGLFTISAIAFPYTLDRMSPAIDPAEYTIRLSTTNREVGGLSSVDMASNVGGDVVLVFSGPLTGDVPRGGALTFTLPVPFAFDPGAGNLLLDVIKSGGVFFGDDGVYLDSSTALDGVSGSLWRSGNTYFVNPSFGLVTAFAGDPAPVPEPATMLLFATGAAGLFARLRRRGEEKAISGP